MKWILTGLLTLAAAMPAAAQTFTIRGFGDVGATAFTAQQSFEAVLGSRAGVVFGGGVEAILPQHIFIDVRASRFKKTGSRVFVSGGEQFDLGIDDTMTITPVEISAGYRFMRPVVRGRPVRPGWRTTVVPYVGAGIGWHRFREVSTGADTTSEDVDETFHGYQLLGGVDYRLTRIISVAGEAQWASVPNALGQNPSAVSTTFDETNLGGTTVRVKLVVGGW
jgi:opacity protein-like surface antigen